MFRVFKRAPWIALGAGVAWLFDADKGAERRQVVKLKLESMTGRRGQDGQIDADVFDEGSAVRAA